MFKQLDMGSIKPALDHWLRQKIGDPGLEAVNMRTPGAGGMSNDTILFETRDSGGRIHERLVARLAPTEQLVFPSYDLSAQFKVMSRLADSGIPVPETRWLEEDTEILGTPFYVMGAVDGEAPSDVPPYHTAGLCVEADVGQRETMWWSGLDTMAAIHALDWEKAGFDFLGKPASAVAALDAQLSYWENYLDWARTDEPQPVIDAGRVWLRENSPSPSRTALCWGDSRLPNMMFKDFKVAAVLDWEMAFIGDPEADLAWWLFLDWHHSAGYGLERLEGLPGREQTVARYQEISGRPVENLFYYEVFAAYRFAAIMIRVVENLKVRGFPLSGPDFGSNNPCTCHLAELLELPSPSNP
jgi:aminoglycoside phosphotransferase (APT) family kinase protein